MVKVFQILVVIFVSGLALSYFFKGLENTQLRFDTYNELANTPNIFEVGWIPVWIPKSAREIVEKHNIDTNIVRITFLFDTKEESWDEECYKHNIEISQIPQEFNIIKQSRANASSGDLRLFKCKQNRYLATIDEGNTSKGFIWN
jgi:FlaA1/EpsC-like NDP-sugar epimerase